MSDEYKKTLKEARLEAGRLMTKKQLESCHAIIHTASAACGALGAIPIPVVDAIPMTAAQITMVISLGKVFDMELTETAAKTILSGVAAPLIGQHVARALLKWVPIAGEIINVGVAAGITEAIGWLIANDFARQYRNRYQANRQKEMQQQRMAHFKEEQQDSDDEKVKDIINLAEMMGEEEQATGIFEPKDFYTEYDQKNANILLLREYAKDDSKYAVSVCKNYAEAGDAIAANQLGLYYFQRGRDYEQAIRYFQMASDLGLPVGALNLGWCYQEGKGCEADQVKASTLLELAKQAMLEQGKNGEYWVYSDLCQMFRKVKGIKRHSVSVSDNMRELIGARCKEIRFLEGSADLKKKLGIEGEAIYLMSDDSWFKNGSSGFAVSYEGIYTRSTFSGIPVFTSYEEMAEVRNVRFEKRYELNAKKRDGETKTIAYYTNYEHDLDDINHVHSLVELFTSISDMCWSDLYLK